MGRGGVISGKKPWESGSCDVITFSLAMTTTVTTAGMFYLSGTWEKTGVKAMVGASDLLLVFCDHDFWSRTEEI